MGGHVVRIGEIEISTKFLSENLKGRDHWRDLGVDGRTVDPYENGF
jgi:hypothetical protein